MERHIASKLKGLSTLQESHHYMGRSDMHSKPKPLVPHKQKIYKIK